MDFKDNFSVVSDDYQVYRPRYPRELFDYLFRVSGPVKTAWDCGCGNGQGALGLTSFCRRVIATDPSENQIASAIPHPKVEYRIAPAEHSGLADESVELVLIAQAIHWFDFESFFKELRRVAVNGAPVAAVGYTLSRINAEIDGLIDHFYSQVVGPYWPPERNYMDNNYQTIPFPLDEKAIGREAIEEKNHLYIRHHWTLDHMMGYLSTWSAVSKYREQVGQDPLIELRASLQSLWGDSEREVVWPIVMRIGRLIK